MLEKIIGRKIELLPKEPKEDQILCDECGGTGWLLRDNKWIENCPHCRNGLKDICLYCGDCYTGTKHSHLLNSKECYEKEEVIKERKRIEDKLIRYEKATKVRYDECPDESKFMMFSENYGYDEGYFTDLDELADYVNSEDEVEMPKYVWATYKIPLSIDADDIIENACSDLHENASDNIFYEEELQEILDKWCEKQSGVDTYYVDYKLAILVPEEMLS